MLTDAKKKFIEFMMSCDVLRFGDFVTKSGRRTPYFVNMACTARARRSRAWATSTPPACTRWPRARSTRSSAPPTRAFRW